MRFVVADDMRPARLYASRILANLGQVVGEAGDGREAVTLCSRHRPDVVLLDYSMPIMTGAQAARAILAAGSARFVCMATSVHQDAAIAEMRKLGVHIVGKPYYDHRLLREISEITKCP